MPIFEFPSRSFLEIGGASANSTSHTLSADTNNMGIVFVAEFTMSVKKAWVRQTTAGASGGGSLTVSIETVNTTEGLPTGTTIVSQAFPHPVTFPVTFTTPGTINKGTPYCLKVTQTGAVTTPNCVLNAGVTNLTLESLVPYLITNNSRNSTRQVECWYLEDNSGSPLVMGYPFDSPAASNPVSNALQAGMKVKIPTSVCTTYKVLGMKLSTLVSDVASPSTYTGPDIRIFVYDWNGGNNSTALETTDISPQIQSSSTNLGVNEYWFDNPPTLNAGSDYIVAFGTADTASSSTVCTARNVTVPDTTKPALWDQTNNYTWDRVSRTSYTGSWTTTANSMYAMSLILDVASLPSGGLIVHPGMAGGMRG